MTDPKDMGQGADVPEFKLPVNKTGPWVFAIGGVIVVAAGLAFFIMRGKDDPQPTVSREAAIHSARITEAEAKAKREAYKEHLEITRNALEKVAEQEQAAAAASAAAQAAEPGSNTEQKAQAGKASPARKGASGSDLDRLDKLGGQVNSELKQ